MLSVLAGQRVSNSAWVLVYAISWFTQYYINYLAIKPFSR